MARIFGWLSSTRSSAASGVANARQSSAPQGLPAGSGEAIGAAADADDGAGARFTSWVGVGRGGGWLGFCWGGTLGTEAALQPPSQTMTNATRIIEESILSLIE